jgi:hypothetical protein
MYYVVASSIDLSNSPDPNAGEFRQWIDAGIAFDEARVCYADWAYPGHIAYQASTVTVDGDVSTGSSTNGTTANFSGGVTTLTGSGGFVEWTFADGMVVLGVDGGSVAYHRVCWLSTNTDVNSGDDTVVFLHQGEGIGAAKVSTFSWFEGTAPAADLAGNFGSPAGDANLSAAGFTFVQPTSALANYVGWDANLPAGNDLGVPRTVNETIINGADADGKWLYVKAVTDGGGGLFANGAQIDGFMVSFGCCVQRGDVNNSGGDPDIADVTYLVAYAFKGGPAPPCIDHGDVNGSGGDPDIADVTYLVAYAFKGGPPPAPCN